jgi:sec-independent protein translocase protein TatA
MFSGLESPMHLLVVLIIAMLVFGPKKLPELGKSLGHGIRGFKDSLEGKDEAPAEQVVDVTAATAAAEPAAVTAATTTSEANQDAR